MRSYCDHTFTEPQGINRASSSAHNQCAPVIFSMAVDGQNLLIVQQLAHMQAHDDQVFFCQHNEKEEEKKEEEMLVRPWALQPLGLQMYLPDFLAWHRGYT